ncbi:hypothetical protein THIOSC15_3380002 [uncultured Thiomicrorhabdus sp.]
MIAQVDCEYKSEKISAEKGSNFLNGFRILRSEWLKNKKGDIPQYIAFVV